MSIKPALWSHRLVTACLAGVLSLLFILPVAASGDGKVEVTATVNVDKIGVEDNLVYTIRLEGIKTEEKPELQNLDGFRISQTSHSTEYRFLNGKSTYFTNFIYYLAPQRKGTLNIAPFVYKHEGKSYRTRAFNIKVVEGSLPSAKAKPERLTSIFKDDDLFKNNPGKRRSAKNNIDLELEAELSGTSVVKGEPITLRVLLVTRNRIKKLERSSVKPVPGLSLAWFPRPKTIKAKERFVQGEKYHVYEIDKAVVSVTRTGTINIPSLTYVFNVEFKGSPSSQSKKVIRTTGKIAVRVSAVPPKTREPILTTND